jgi:hypothetical protein
MAFPCRCLNHRPGARIPTRPSFAPIIVGEGGRVTVAPLQKSAPSETSFVADVAAQVVAWHNRHPLARRIARKDVQSIGIVTLPFARPAQPAWDAARPKRGLLALMFPKRVDRRPWPAFSEDALPDIGAARLAQFALKLGWIERPGPAGLPERALQVDRDRLDQPPGRRATDEPPERLDRFLVTAAIDLGPTRPRLVLGRGGRRMPVLGQRLWSLPRIAALGGAVLMAVVVGVAGLWVAATGRRSADAARGGAVPASAAAASSSAAAGPTRPLAAPAASAAASWPARPASAAPMPSAPAPVPAPAASAPAPAHTPAPAPVPGTAAASAATPVASTAPDTAAPPGSSAVAAPPPSITQRASAPLVPSLRPDLAASARAEAARHPGLPQRTPPSTATGAQPPADGASAARAPARFYALVSRPLRNEAEADALLKRLRAETQRIAHPTAIETGLQRTPEGWRVTWWPFTHPRQAENARAALAARRVDLDLVEF